MLFYLRNNMPYHSRIVQFIVSRLLIRCKRDASTRFHMYLKDIILFLLSYFVSCLQIAY
ncbi:hypothetical protein BDZ45DRAFT_98420 [Acephala macrosclerotiorum]|nr:hypothetical protein BDZ45DRAFT_98420 [Acephala macrosclerotiorum]